MKKREFVIKFLRYLELLLLQLIILIWIIKKDI